MTALEREVGIEIGLTPEPKRVKEEWRRAKQRLSRTAAARQAVKRSEATLGLTTQNDRGLKNQETTVCAWFAHFRQQDDDGC